MYRFSVAEQCVYACIVFMSALTADFVEYAMIFESGNAFARWYVLISLQKGLRNLVFNNKLLPFFNDSQYSVNQRICLIV